jgi:hypothetical protein
MVAPASFKALRTNSNGSVKEVDISLATTLDQANNASVVGAATNSAGLSCDISHFGPLATLTFTYAALSIPVVDAGGSGSSGSLKIFDFVQGSVDVLGCRQDYTAFAEGAALTTGAGDAAFVMGLGSVAATAHNGSLSGTEVDIGSVTGTLTNSGNTTTGTKHSGALGAIDGTATATDMYLNWSGTTATIDGNSTISVTGTSTVLVAMLGDD